MRGASSVLAGAAAGPVDRPDAGSAGTLTLCAAALAVTGSISVTPGATILDQSLLMCKMAMFALEPM